jgi:hypothetical protein
MEKTVKSNLTLSVAMLVIGIAGLMVMVWLSPSPSEEPSGGTPGVLAAPEQAPSSTVPAQGSRTNAVDPFFEKLGATVALDAAKGPETLPASRENTIPLGVDPFKEKLLQQSKQSIASPFGQPVTKP